MSSDLVSVENLRVRLPADGDRSSAVHDVSFVVPRGKILCLVGESGSGKSMTAHAIMGLIPRPLQMTGRILFEGENLVDLPPARLRAHRGRKIGMIFQEPMAALNPVMKVGKQIEEVFRYHGIPGPYDEKVVELLGQMGLPDPDNLRHAHPHRLSGGQRQRVMIAIALALGPDLLIADEPTTALDVTTQKQILALLKTAQRDRGMSIMLITHDLSVVAEIGDSMVVMQHGRIVERGTVADVLSSPSQDYTRSLLAAVPRLTRHHTKSDKTGDAVLITARGVTKTYVNRSGFLGPRRVSYAVQDAHFTLSQGETLGVVGESGSGKTTLARIIMRLLNADSGDVRMEKVDGNLLTMKSAALRPVRRRIQMVFQDPFGSLNPRSTVFEIIAQGLLAHGIDRTVARRRVAELLELVALEPGAADRYPIAFSGGQRQRIGIARALALEPDVIVADEAVSALDVSIQAKILKLIEDLQHRFRLGLLFITHDLRVAAQICDHVLVMRQGRIVESGPCSKVLFSPQHEYTRLLIDSIPGRNLFAEPALDRSHRS
ncbi:MAG: ABC transporter ATP-binding protein [Proteobacteria bacterium]|nr:ABC transporter ATP-binding protein [Pseudomonadota bacterium]